MTGSWFSFLKLIIVPMHWTHRPGSRRDSVETPVMELAANMRTGTVPSLQTRYSVPAVKVLILPGISVSALSVAPAVASLCMIWKPENPYGALARATADTIVNIRNMGAILIDMAAGPGIPPISGC
jgi:hypothetical protein